MTHSTIKTSKRANYRVYLYLLAMTTELTTREFVAMANTHRKVFVSVNSNFNAILHYSLLLSTFFQLSILDI